MRPDSIFVSIVHQIYNHELLLQMAGDNRIYGYAFETDTEFMGDFSGNVWAAPQQAWNTKESLDRNLALWLENILQAGLQIYSNRVN